MNFHLKDSFRVKFTAYEGEMIKEEAMTSCIGIRYKTHMIVLRLTI